MADRLPEPTYIAGLATTLQHHHPNLLQAAENDLQRLRTALALVTAWIHNPAYDRDARHALAELLGIPTPRTPGYDAALAAAEMHAQSRPQSGDT